MQTVTKQIKSSKYVPHSEDHVDLIHFRLLATGVSTKAVAMGMIYHDVLLRVSGTIHIKHVTVMHVHTIRMKSQLQDKSEVKTGSCEW